MAKYLVKWEIDLDADNEYAAAEKAREIQRDPESTATFFEVTQRHREGKTYIDLFMKGRL